MEDDIFFGIANRQQIESEVVQTFQKSFVQVQNILDGEINQNHESKVLDNLSQNVGLIQDLNNNIRRVVELRISTVGLSSRTIPHLADAIHAAGIKAV
ncbi:ELF4-like 4 [Perilla frutescens var. frutescens]|nr:ELF4-like 4 [Perilla frutescens var. frutescens]